MQKNKQASKKINTKVKHTSDNYSDLPEIIFGN